MTGPELPPGWRLVIGALDGNLLEGSGPAGRFLQVEWRDISVDGKTWRHLAVSVPTRNGWVPDLPGWLELDWTRTQLIGPDVEAYQVHPPGYRVPSAVHLFACLDSPGAFVPDFVHDTHRP